MKSNYFSNKVKSRSTEDLINVGTSQEGFAEKFVLAALWELDARDELTEDLKDKLAHLELREQAVKQKSEHDNYLVPPDLPRQIKTAVFILYSIFALELLERFALNSYSTLDINSIEIPGGLITLVVAMFIHSGKAWARYAFYIVFVSSTLFFVLGVQPITTISLIQQMLFVAAMYFILSKPSRMWYKAKTGAKNSHKVQV